MGIEMHERRRRLPLRQRAQQRQGNTVVAAQGHEMRNAARVALDQR